MVIHFINIQFYLFIDDYYAFLRKSNFYLASSYYYLYSIYCYLLVLSCIIFYLFYCFLLQKIICQRMAFWKSIQSPVILPVHHIKTIDKRYATTAYRSNPGIELIEGKYADSSIKQLLIVYLSIDDHNNNINQWQVQYVNLNIIMRVSGYRGQNNLQIKIPNAEADTVTIKTVQQKMKEYLITLDFNNTKKIQTITNLTNLIAFFAEIITQLSKNINAPQSALQMQLNFYKERDSNHEKVIKSMKEEMLTYMKNVSHKQAEIDKYEAQIFRFKQIVEEKEKTILQLTLQNRQNNKNLPLQNSRSQEKIGKKGVKSQNLQVNQEISNGEKVSKNSVMLNPYIVKEDWELQKNRLLKVIRDKDLKIYELIQQMKTKK